PANATSYVNADAQFSVAASGVAPLSYEWLKNGTPVAVTGASSYATPVLTQADDGAQYAVIVTAGNGLSTRSAAATLSVTNAPIPLPMISAQPIGVAVAAGATVQLSVGASGVGPITYQWRKNGANIAGATDAMYTTPPLTILDNGNVYSVLVSNGGGSV